MKSQFGGEMNWKLATESLKEQTIRPGARRSLHVAVGGRLSAAHCGDERRRPFPRARHQAASRNRGAHGSGAPRWRVARQLVIESLGLAFVAGAVRLGIAAGIIAVVRMTAADTLPRLSEVRMDGGAFAIAVGLSIMTGLLFGLLPSWLSSKADPAEALRQLGRPGSGGAGARGAAAGRSRSSSRSPLCSRRAAD